MKIIKTQNHYKISSLFEADNGRLLDAFWDTFNDIISDKNVDYLLTSYSYLSSLTDNNVARNPEKDFKMILAEFNDAGWDVDALNKLFAKYGDKIAEDYNEEHVPIRLSGMIDYFLYKMTQGKVILMGYVTNDIYTDVKGDEAFFKFYYGYNKTPYGKLAMIQHFGSLDEYYDYLGDNFVNLIGKDETVVIYGQDEFMKAVREMKIDNLPTFYSYDKARKIGTLDLKAAGIDIENSDIVRQRQSTSVNVDGVMDNDFETVSPGAMLDLLIEFMEGCGFDMKNDPKYKFGGRAEIEDGVLKMYFDTEN